VADAVRLLGQGVLYAAFAAFVGTFSSWPPYSPIGPDEALVRLSFSQPGERVAECRERSADELAKLPPQMRAQQECGRERSAIAVRIDLDGRTVLEESFPPSGLHRDGPANAYRRLVVPAGEHALRVRIGDDLRRPDRVHERSERVVLDPGRVLLVDFAGERGGIVFR
jgi:hypothetical protein